jgi:hypothetical protein
MVSKTIQVDETLSEDVLQFAQQHGIVEYVEKAMKAAREVFTDAERVTASLKRDPEYANIYVDVHVVLRPDEEPETAAEKESECVSRWVSFMPPQVDQISLSSSWAS